MQEGNYARTPVDQEDAKSILTPGNIKEIYNGGFAQRGDVTKLESLTFRSSTRPSPVPGRQLSR